MAAPELTTLTALAQALSRPASLAESLHAALATVAEALGLETGWIWLVDDESEEPRLAAARAAIPRAIALAGALGAGDSVTMPARPTRRRGPAVAGAMTAPSATASAPGAGPPDDDPDASTDEEAGLARIPAVERRRGVEILLGLWADVARDLALVVSGGARSVHDTVLLDELSAISAAIPPGSAGAFLARAARSAELLAGNVSPELVLDALVLAWPSRSAAA